MKVYTKKEVWFITGSQHLYGEETLAQVGKHAEEIARTLDQSEQIPLQVVYQPIVTRPEEVYDTIMRANQEQACVGIITWMHTFSPAKMWIRGLKSLQKPMLHLHTQFNRDIPWESIDMDFMNLNQSAHGDREFGFMVSRLRMERKVVVGHWQSAKVSLEIGKWSRAACGWQDWQGAKFVRFGDNMRQVAVTEGDKVAAEMKFGFSVNTHPVSELVAKINEVSGNQVEELVKLYEKTYDLAESLTAKGAKRDALLEAAKIEIGLQRFLEEGGYKGFTDTFEDLEGLKQLPGIAVQRLMAKGYGFGAEGDWKTAALVRAMKIMGKGLEGANAFMEDYTYHFDPEDSLVLGSHMLEVDEALAEGKVRCEVHPLGIGGKEDPVRLVFNVGEGAALNAALMDMGNRFRLLVNEVKAVAPKASLPKLPVARVLWKPLPDMETACKAWILAGGAHHTCFSQNLDLEVLEDFAAMANLELLTIDKETEFRKFKKEIQWNEIYYKNMEGIN
ncbi:L-arabinose isomerase [Pleomorphovibrio marinus]|uniref:L-arabinose isomerase n=1 Tax=Pleomorphovibrio marinus TaxID=2164132 RepID=UPI000E0B996D|nr:L-arabinose isomerase [Pleomorphovibrio marinus]